MSDQINSGVAEAAPSSATPSAPSTNTATQAASSVPSASEHIAQTMAAYQQAESQPDDANPYGQQQEAAPVEGEQPAAESAEIDEAAELTDEEWAAYQASLQEEAPADPQAFDPATIPDEQLRDELTRLHQERVATSDAAKFGEGVLNHFKEVGIEDPSLFTNMVQHLLNPHDEADYNGTNLPRSYFAADALMKAFPTTASSLFEISLAGGNSLLVDKYEDVISALAERVPQFNEQFVPRSEVEAYMDSDIRSIVMNYRESLTPDLRSVFDKLNIAQQDSLIKADPMLAKEHLYLHQIQQHNKAQELAQQQAEAERVKFERQQEANITLQQTAYGMINHWTKDAQANGFSELEAAGLAGRAFEKFDADTYKSGTKANELFGKQQEALAAGDKAAFKEAKQEYEREAFKTYAMLLRQHIKPGAVRSKLRATKSAAPAAKPKVTNSNPQFTPSNSNGRVPTAEEHLNEVFAAYQAVGRL